MILDGWMDGQPENIVPPATTAAVAEALKTVIINFRGAGRWTFLPLDGARLLVSCFQSLC